MAAVSIGRSSVPSLNPVSLIGPRLVLREVEPADAAAAFEWGSDPEWFKYSLFDPVTHRPHDLTAPASPGPADP
jgi:hypothetical protein